MFKHVDANEIFRRYGASFDIKKNLGKGVGRTQETHRPILLTSRVRGATVVQSPEEYEKAAEELGFLRAVYQVLEETRDGNTVSLEEAKKSLGGLGVINTN